MAEPTPVELEVLPSILIEAFAPLDVECSAPAFRALAGIPYHLRVRAVGLKAVRFEYGVAEIGGQPGLTRFVHDFAGVPVSEDELGPDEAILFNPVPDDEQLYATGVRVLASDAAGHTVETAFPVTVHRPVEVVNDGKREPAERYQPVPVSGCTPGSVRTRVTIARPAPRPASRAPASPSARTSPRVGAR